jgi:hypothetical protein
MGEYSMKICQLKNFTFLYLTFHTPHNTAVAIKARSDIDGSCSMYGGMRNAYEILAKKPQAKRCTGQLATDSCTVSNLKMVSFWGLNWTQDAIQYFFFFFAKGNNSLVSKVTISFSHSHLILD